MAGAAVDGFLKGFNMMERHQSRKFNEQRLSDLDKRNEERYQQGQQRQAELDKERRDNRANDVAWREQQAADNKAHRELIREDTNEYRQWQKNYQENEQQYKRDQPDIALGWQAFRETGSVPEEFKAVFERNPTKDPRAFTDKGYRESVNQLFDVTQDAIKTGQLSKVNDPKTLQMFDVVYGPKLKASIGTYDESVKSKIADVKTAGIIPTESKDGRVAIALEVTYENGSKEIKPMTKGRTSDPDDPVMTYTPKELLGTISASKTMADMMERPDYYDQLGDQVLRANGQNPDREHAVIENNINGIMRSKQEAENAVIEKFNKMTVDEFGNPLPTEQVEQLNAAMQTELQNVRARYNAAIDNNVRSYGNRLRGTSYAYLLDQGEIAPKQESPPPSGEAQPDPKDDLVNKILNQPGGQQTAPPQQQTTTKPQTLSDIPQRALNM